MGLQNRLPQLPRHCAGAARPPKDAEGPIPADTGHTLDRLLPGWQALARPDRPRGGGRADGGLAGCTGLRGGQGRGAQQHRPERVHRALAVRGAQRPVRSRTPQCPAQCHLLQAASPASPSGALSARSPRSFSHRTPLRSADALDGHWFPSTLRTTKRQEVTSRRGDTSSPLPPPPCM